MKIVIRPAQSSDLPFLRDMLYESIYIPEGEPRPDRAIIDQPCLAKYVEGWGRDGDIGFIAEDGRNGPVGSATLRFFKASSPGYGFVDESTPELGIAVVAKYRGRGIGTMLLRAVFAEARNRGIGAVSLSVDPRNPAQRLYERFGFQAVGRVGESVTMKLDLSNDKQGGPPMNDRLMQQLAFIVEVDKVKGIIRRTKLFHEDRRENDAEHSWTIALMALILAEHVNEPVDLLKTVKMLLIHDIVEIDSGDVLIYQKTADISRSEEAAADRIFGLLPEDQRTEYVALWHEFEDRRTPEAKFAAALDRIEPVMQNINRRGELWRENVVSYERILGINTRIGEGSEAIWKVIKAEIDRLRDEGLIPE